MTTRRELIVALGAVAVSASFPLVAQQRAGKLFRIGLLGVASPSGYAAQVEAFRSGLRDLGYIEGANLVIEYRWAEGKVASLPDLAAELVRLKPDVLVSSGAGVSAAKRTTSTIPIVMTAAGDAVEAGLVESLGRPGGNVTGSSYFFRELNVKRLELLKEVLPRLNRVGVLLFANSPANPWLLRAMEDAARLLKVRLQAVEAQSVADFPRAFVTLKGARAEALVVTDHTMLVAEASRISGLARTNGLPAIGFAEIADTGGLLAYGVNFPDLWRRAAGFVDKILKGAKAADLPVEQPTKFEVIVNLRTAKALGIIVPRAMLLRATRMIE